MWRRSEATIRKLFKYEKGVQHLIGPGLLLGTAKRAYDTMTIPATVALRLYERLKQPPVPVKLPKRELRTVKLRDRRIA